MSTQSKVLGNTNVMGNVTFGETNPRTKAVVYLPMTAGSGSPEDKSDAGNGLDGTLVNAIWTTGRSKTGGNAVEFDGYQDAIDLGTNSKLTPTTAFSISIWAYCTDFDSDYTSLFRRWDTGGGEDKQAYALITGESGDGNGKLNLFIMKDSPTSTGDYSLLRTDAEVLSTNQWHHIVATYSGAEGRMRIYVDNVLKDATLSGQSIPSSINVASTMRAALGRNYGTGGGAHHSWNGTLDEFSFWDIELDSTQVSYLYGNGTPNSVELGLYPTV